METMHLAEKEVGIFSVGIAAFVYPGKLLRVAIKSTPEHAAVTRTGDEK